MSRPCFLHGDTMNYAYYEGKGVEIQEVIDLAETLPFFAERRLLVFENTGFFKSSGADLADYIKEHASDHIFYFCGGRGGQAQQVV